MPTINKETRITFTVPEQFARLVKTYAGARGKTVKSVMMEAFTKSITKNQNNNEISESEANTMLKPLIEKYVKQIQDKTFSGRTLEEIKMIKELKSADKEIKQGEFISNQEINNYLNSW